MAEMNEAARGGLTIARMSQPPGGWRTAPGVTGSAIMRPSLCIRT